jgi:hypothetical protein
MHSSIMPESGLEFREARNADSPAIQELVISVLEGYGLQPDLKNTDADLFQVYDSYQKQGGYFCLIEKRNHEFGMIYSNNFMNYRFYFLFLCPLAYFQTQSLF